MPAADHLSEPDEPDSQDERERRSRVQVIIDLLAWTWLVLLGAAAVFAPVLPLPEGRDVAKTLSEPILLRPDLLSEHPLGTDRQGLDLLAQSIEGARVSLLIGLGAVAIGVLVGGGLGLVAGYFRGRPERAIQTVTDSLLAFPPLILLLALVTALQPSTLTIAAALGLLVLPTYSRLARANTLAVTQQEFVLAARMTGARNLRVLLREVAPNVALPVLSYSFVVGAVLIVAEASLSFIGLGIQRPDPTWGNMIAAAQNDLDKNPHLVFVPGAVLFLTVFALNRLGESVRSHLEPRDTGR